LQVLLNNIAKLSDYTSQFFYSLDQGLSWALVNPRNPPVLWLRDLPLLQLRPAKGLQGSLDFSLGKTQPKGERGIVASRFVISNAYSPVGF
jgi:hypothetical protein